jgi:hypothetical protein
MTKQEAIKIVRHEVKQLAVAAAESSMQDEPKRSGAKGHPLVTFDRLAETLAGRALAALDVIEQE